MSGSTTLQVDRDAREVFNLAAIAIGMRDAEAAFEVCRKLVAIEEHYTLRLRAGDEERNGGRAEKANARRGEHCRLTSAPSSDGGPDTRSATAAALAREAGVSRPTMELRRMPAKYPGRCAKCARGISVGMPIAYDTASKRAFHEECVG
jgi:hypothetical protein